MQASQAKDSTVILPRAIVKRTAAMEAMITQRKAESEALSAEPVTEVTPTATPVEPATPAVPADPRDSDPEYWKQRFRVTEGVLRSERTQRQSAEAETNRRLTEMQEQIRTLKAATPKPEVDPDVSQFFTPEQIDQFGEEQCKAMARAAVKSASVEVSRAIEEEIKPLREQQTQRETQATEAKKQDFTDKLGEIVPDFREIDVDPAWIAWLQEDDPTTGVQRQMILNAHVTAQNAPKTAKVFQDFLRSKSRPTPPVAARGGAAGPSGDPPAQLPASSLKPPTGVEIRDYFKRSALGHVKDQERIAFEARLKLISAA